MIYQVNFDKWILSVLPSFLRRSLIFAILRAMCAPVTANKTGIYPRFLSARDEHLYRLAHNGQVCYLRAALNDAFGYKDKPSGGFTIEDYTENVGEWQYAKHDGMNEQLYPVDESLNPNLPAGETADPAMPILYGEEILNQEQYHFIVGVPSAIYETNLDKVKAIVEKYRLLSKVPIYTPI